MSFHAPSKFRLRSGPMKSNEGDGNNGYFVVPETPKHRALMMVASDGLGWEHVSVHAETRQGPAIPTWNEMCYIKDLCWDAEDVVMQLHPRASEYVNTHPWTLHLWRPIGRDIPEPPSTLVGFKDVGAYL